MRPAPANAERLTLLMQEVLADFAYLDTLPLQATGEELPLSCHADLPGAAGWLVLRTSQALADRIAEESLGESREGLGGDAFLELCNLAASHLASELGLSHGDWRPFVPAAGLPAGQPAVTITLDVEGQALEAGLWTAP